MKDGFYQLIFLVNLALRAEFPTATKAFPDTQHGNNFLLTFTINTAITRPMRIGRKRVPKDRKHLI